MLEEHSRSLRSLAADRSEARGGSVGVFRLRLNVHIKDLILLLLNSLADAVAADVSIHADSTGGACGERACERDCRLNS